MSGNDNNGEPGLESLPSFPSTRGGRRPAPMLEVEVVRVLGEADVPLLAAPPSTAFRNAPLAQVRHSHHQLAQLLARGMSVDEAALITGYSPGRIYALVGDPTFGELMAHYQAMGELRFVDVLERMRVLGLTTLDEIQHRMEETPEKFTQRDLMELTELLLVKGRAGPGGGAGGGPNAGPGVTVNVKFVSAGQGGSAVTIDGKVADG